MDWDCSTTVQFINLKHYSHVFELNMFEADDNVPDMSDFQETLERPCKGSTSRKK